LFQHRNKKIKNALIDSRHIITDLDKKEMKKRMNDIESEEINDYLKKRVTVVSPEEILFLSKEINSILSD
jgi:16S rRNA (adenine1518-N6/adenine1519-N6)-dimethyltransferase